MNEEMSASTSSVSAVIVFPVRFQESLLPTANSHTRQCELPSLHERSQKHANHTSQAEGAQGTCAAVPAVVDGRADSRRGAGRRPRALFSSRDGDSGGIACADGLVEGRSGGVRIDA